MKAARKDEMKIRYAITGNQASPSYVIASRYETVSNLVTPSWRSAVGLSIATFDCSWHLRMANG